MIEQKIISKIEENIKSIEIFLSKKEIYKLEFPTEWTFYFIMERYLINLKTIRKLLPNLKNDGLYEIPIGLIIRTSILDSLTSLDIFCLTADGDEMEEKIQNILLDNVFITINYFNDLHQYGEIETNDLRKAKENMEEGLKILLEKIGKKDINELIKEKKNFKINTPKSIFDKLMASKYRNFGKCYDYYNYYSKFEHFGVLYPMLSRQKYEEKIDLIENSLKYIFLIIEILMSEENKYEA